MPGRCHERVQCTGNGGTDDAGPPSRLDDSPNDPEDEGFACQRQEWLAREAGGAQPRRNDAEDGHGGTYKIRAGGSSPEPKRLICWRVDGKRGRARRARKIPATPPPPRERTTL